MIIDNLQLQKSDYDYLMRQAARGSLLCEFLDSKKIVLIKPAVLKRYIKELRQIEEAILSTLCDVIPE